MENYLQNDDDFIVRLQTSYASLRKSERKIADYLQKNANQRLDVSITEFAKQIKVSEATISRFCRAVGFDGFQDLKLSLAESLRGAEEFKNIPVNIDASDSLAEVGKKLADALTGMLVETQRSLDINQINAAVDAIVEARQVMLYGIGGAAAVLKAANHLFVKAGIQCARYEDGYMQRIKPGKVGLLLFDLTDPNVFIGYTSKDATEKKIFRDVFKKGDKWFNSGDLMRDMGNNHAQFIDRLGDTFRWKSHNISTTEVDEVLNTFEDIKISSSYGVSVPGNYGRAGMATIIPRTSLDFFNFKGITEHLKRNLAPYAIPIFLRFKTSIDTTSTIKFKKNLLKKEGFNIEKYQDPFYVLLPGENEYLPLTKKIYEQIQNNHYKF